jgi:hypothetical protein
VTNKGDPDRVLRLHEWYTGCVLLGDASLNIAASTTIGNLDGTKTCPPYEVHSSMGLCFKDVDLWDSELSPVEMYQHPKPPRFKGDTQNHVENRSWKVAFFINGKEYGRFVFLYLHYTRLERIINHDKARLVPFLPFARYLSEKLLNNYPVPNHKVHEVRTRVCPTYY